ncbi:MAG: hypothetical protein KJO04_02160, partial [Bacteroidia bacterium]|nr:hypothetical protein [Bacteroidia bacterium]
MAILLACVLGTLILSLPPVQTRLAKMTMNRINSDFGTNIAIDRLKVSLISWDTSVRGIYIEDYKKDTLAYIHELSTSILSIQNVMKGKMDFGDVDIEGLDLKVKTYQDTTYT